MADEKVTVDSLVTAHAAAKNAPAANASTTTTNAATTQDANAAAAATTTTQTTTDADPVKDLLKELNVESLDVLKERLKPKVEAAVESPEEKQKREDLYKVDLQRHAVEQGLMKPEDFVQMENLKAKDDRSLVYDRWLPSWKEENPDVLPEDVERQSREDFESEKGLNTTNEKKKARAEAQIAKEAKEIRSPIETSYGKAKSDFDDTLAINKDLPEFSKKLASFIQENIPATIKLFETKDGDDTVPVEIPLTDDQRREIYTKVEKKLSNRGMLDLYRKNDLTQLQEIAKREAAAEIWNEHREEGLKKIAETFLERGDKKGYARGSVGSKNPFPLNQNHQKVEDKNHQSKEQQVLDSLQGKK